MDYVKLLFEVIEKLRKSSPLWLGLIAIVGWIALGITPLQAQLENNEAVANALDAVQLCVYAVTFFFAVSLVDWGINFMRVKSSQSFAISSIEKLKGRDATIMTLCTILEIREIPRKLGNTQLTGDDTLGLERKGILIRSRNVNGEMSYRFPDFIIHFLDVRKVAILNSLFEANPNLGNRLARFLNDPDIAKMVYEHLKLIVLEEINTNPPIELLQLADKSSQQIIADVPSDIADE